jgi:hypothetical protein
MQMPEEVLRAVNNLNKNDDPNWIILKGWISGQRDTIVIVTAKATEVSNERLRVLQGQSQVLYDLDFFFQNAAMLLKEERVREERAERHIEGIV